MCAIRFAALLLLLGACASSDRAGAPVRVARLRCNHLENPIGIDDPNPRLGWILESKRPSEKQTAYQVRVRRGSALLWDSGRVASSRLFAIYEGTRTSRACWSVRVWDGDGLPVDSAEATWEMLPTSWSATWIGLPPAGERPPKLVKDGLKWIWYPEGDPSKGAPSATRYFRRTFEVPDNTLADLVLTADNHFKATVNGTRVLAGDEWTHFHHAKLLLGGHHELIVEASNDDGPAGLIGEMIIGGKAIPTDRTWESSTDGKEWKPAIELGGFGAAPWVTLSDRVGAIRREPCPFLRKRFTLDHVGEARLYATALGLYEMQINGVRVGRDCFTPGWTDYNRRVQVQAYDVTNLLRAGQNDITAILGDGWYAGKLGWGGASHLYGESPLKVFAELHVDGSVIATDGTWEGATGPILAADLYDGEVYDARREGILFWNPVTVFNEKRALVASPGPPVRLTQELAPVAIKEHKAGIFIADLGQNMVGWVRLKATAASGTEITLRFAEVLNPDGSIYTANLRGAKCTDRYICRGGGLEVHEPRFTFHGFRYVEITGYPGTPTKDSITGCVAHTDARMTGTFSCSNEMINKLQQNIAWGQRGNFLEVPTDCPQRDERPGWMGDAEIFVHTACFNMDVAAFFTKWMRDVDDGQSPEGSFADVSPRVLLGPDGAPAWGDAGVIVPWAVYEAYGDERFLDEHRPAMRRWVDYIKKNNPNLL